MMPSSPRRAPIWFRTIAIALLLWGVAGCYACYLQFRLGAGAWGGDSDYDRALYAALPVWYNAVYAVGVGTGVLGSLALILRSALARPLFILSFVAVVLQFGWLFAATDIIAHKGAGTVLPFPILIAAIAAGEIRLAGHALRHRWIR